MQRLAPWLAVAFILAVGGAMVLFRQAVEVPSLLKPNDIEVRQLGQKVYAQHCLACHGANLEGQANWRERNAQGFLPAPPHDASGHTWHHPSAYLIDWVKKGPAAMIGDGYQSTMPPYEGVLTDEEVVAVLSYIKSTWSARIQRAHNQIDERWYESQQQNQN